MKNFSIKYNEDSLIKTESDTIYIHPVQMS